MTSMAIIDESGGVRSSSARRHVVAGPIFGERTKAVSGRIETMVSKATAPLVEAEYFSGTVPTAAPRQPIRPQELKAGP